MGGRVKGRCPEALRRQISGLIILEARNGYRFAKVVGFGTNRGHQRDEAITREIDVDQAEI